MLHDTKKALLILLGCEKSFVDIILFFSFSKMFFFFFIFLTFMEVELICNVVIISAVHQSDSAIHVHTSILFQIIFSHRLSQNIG